MSVLEDISDQKTAENQSAIFKCRIQINYPEIFLSWYKETQRLDNSHKYEISSMDDLHSLKVMNCNSSDEGSYRVVCGPHISNAKLEVAGKCFYFLLLCSIIFLRTGAKLWSAVWSLSRSSPACFYNSLQQCHPCEDNFDPGCPALFGLLSHHCEPLTKTTS